MTTNQKNYLDMFVAVKETYEQHKTVFDVMVARQTAFTNFLAKIAAIQSANAAQSSNTTGITQDKEVLRKNLCNLSYTNMQVIKSYAIATGNNTLKTEMDYELSDLLNTTDESIADFCQLRLDKANTLLASLVDYDITAATITTWQDAIDDYNEALGNPRNASNNQSTITNSIKVLIKETNDMLNNQIDALVQPLKVPQNAVYVQYFKARKIINRGNPPQEPENPNSLTFSGTVTDNVTGAVIENAELIVDGEVVATTNAAGEFTKTFTITEVTSVNLTIRKTGYDDYVTPIQFSPGTDLEQDFNIPRIILTTYQQTISIGTFSLGNTPAGATGLRIRMISGASVTVGFSNDGSTFSGNTETVNATGTVVDRTLAELGGYGMFVLAQNNTAGNVEVRVDVLG